MDGAERSRIEAEIEQLRCDIGELKSMVGENRAILVGRDGNLGLVANVALVSSKMDSIQTMVTNDMAHMTAQMDLMFNSRDTVQQAREELRAEISNLQQGDNVKWKSVLLDWMKPVITAVITAITVYLLTR